MLKRTNGEKIFNIFNICFISILCLSILYPVINILALSFNEGVDAMLGGITIFPRAFTLENYKIALKYPAIETSALVSVLRTVVGTFYHLTIVTLAAYALSKKNLIFRTGILIFFSIPMFIHAGLIPQYINFYKLGLINNFWVYVLPYGFSFYHMVVIRTYISGIPASLEESAFIDGANALKVFLTIILPLSMPALAAIALFQAVGLWNEWLSSLFYISDSRLYTLQYILQKIIKENMAREIVSFSDYLMEMEPQENKFIKYTSASIQMAVLIVTTAPILIVYPFLQKYFVKGVMIGSVKG